MEPAVSISRLVMMLTTMGQQISFLQTNDILPKRGFCQKCHEEIKGEMKVKGNHRYWKCKSCKVKTSLRYGTILYDAKIKLINFICLVYCFTEKNRTKCQISNEASLPQENYQDRTTSSRTILRWFKFFRWICVKDYRKTNTKLGGYGVILEGDESMFGKMKYGKGNGSRRRRAWGFGMKCRDTKRVFLRVCPRDSAGKYKRTKAALWPIILANVHEGTTVPNY